jgi:hypothetical protein
MDRKTFLAVNALSLTKARRSGEKVHGPCPAILYLLSLHTRAEPLSGNQATIEQAHRDGARPKFSTPDFIFVKISPPEHSRRRSD